MSGANPAAIAARTHYPVRLKYWREELEARNSRDQKLSRARLGVAALGFILGWISLKLVIPVAIVFLILVVLHEHNARLQDRALRASGFYEGGMLRIDGGWAGKGNAGEPYRDAHHPYAEDLDLYGPGSLFEMIAQTRTRLGDDVLSAWLEKPASHEEVLARQQAVEELKPMTNLRESYQLIGDNIRAQLSAVNLTAWGRAAEHRLFRGAPWVLFVCALLSLGTLAAFFLGYVSLRPFLVVFVVVCGLFMAAASFVRDALAGLDSRAKDLRLAAEVMRLAGEQRFHSARLLALHRVLAGGATATRSLHLRMDLLDSARNQFFFPIALITLWVPQVALAIERWRLVNGPHLREWIDAIGEFEALLSLSGYAFEHPEASFPVLETAPRVFEAEAIEHPLLAPGKAVANSICFGAGSSALIVISGSNMSGKSTLLRAVGLNTALAWAGAPVRARKLRVSPFQVAASLRATDSVQEGRSRFYAEIKRLRQIVDLTREERPVLFLVDEILSGTNSHDRRIGAEAVLKDLVRRGATGLATTHDLALTRIEGAVNMHFEDEMRDGELHFDYRLRPGVVERSNAIDLMRSIGLID